jgi:hypothetical protein
MFSACVTMNTVGSKQITFGSTVEVLENQATARVEYKGYSVLLQELEKKSKVQMWDETKIEKEKTLLPQGGYVIVRISGYTIDSANTKWWEYIIQNREGKEILRQKGKSDVPKYNVSSSGTTWWNIDIIYLKEKPKNDFTIYLIDKLTNKRSAYKIYTN